MSPASVRASALLAILCSQLMAQPESPTVTLAPVEVTGTRLGRPLAESPINSTVISRETLVESGRLRLGEVLRELPEFSGSQITDMVAFNESRGVTAFDLRGLGTGNTLILVNGRRTTINANPFDLITTYVDMNRFPPSLVERVEILKSGASAVYGADAVGGVVNIITRRQPAGGELSLSYGNTFVTDAAELSASLSTGVTRGRLGLSVGLDYYHRNAQANIDRPFSRSADHTRRFTSAYDYYARLPVAELAGYDGRQLVSANAIVSVAAGQVNGRNGVSVPGLATGAAITTLPGTPGLASATPSFSNPFRGTSGGQFLAAGAASFVAPEVTRGDPNARNLYDWNRDIWTLPEASRLGATSRFDYAGAGYALFGEASGGRNRSRTEYHPRAYSGVVPRTNPYNLFGVDVAVSWRPPDQERRRAITEDDYFGGLLGVRNPAGSALDWEAAVSYSRDEYIDTARGLYLASAVTAALNSTNPATALNPFGGRDYRQPESVLAAIATSAWFGGRADLLAFDGHLSGKLIRLPAGPLQGSAYVEHRREMFSSVSDAASRAGNIMGTGSTGADAEFHRKVQAVSVEAAAPLLGPRPGEGAQARLALEAAARLEDFSGSFSSGAKPSLGLVARPVASLVLRGSLAHTFRAPSLPQLYSPQSDTFYNSVPDPRRPPALTGDASDGPNVPRLVRQGGNPNLAPETGRSRQVGTVWTPRRDKGLSFEATWFRYDLQDLIAGVGPVYILENELGGLGALVHREAGSQTVVNRTSAPVTIISGPAGQTSTVAPGQSTTVPGRLTRVDVFTVNLSRRRLEGWDFGVRDTGQVAGGRWVASAQGTYTDFIGSAFDSSSAPRNYAGRGGSPRWRARGSLDWHRGAWSTGATMAYTASSGYHNANGWYLKPYRVVHVRAAYTSSLSSWLRGLQIAVGIDDIFNETPPLNLDHPIGFSYATIARPQGRFWRLTLRRSW
jgi:outer membrane receptor protein involved in Fe transport